MSAVHSHKSFNSQLKKYYSVYTGGFLAFVIALANKGWKRALAEDPHLKNGLNVARGKITHAEVAAALNASYSPAEEALVA